MEFKTATGNWYAVMQPKLEVIEKGIKTKHP